MHKFYFPIHLDGGNRGCEAICRGTIKVLNLDRRKYIGYCSNVREDKKIGLGKVCTLEADRTNSFFSRARRKIKRLVSLKKANHSLNDWYKMRYSPFLRKISPQDVCMITGGDMFCYDDNELNYIIDVMHSRQIPTILWGCSFGPENLTPAKLNSLNKLTAITARESLTYDYLTSELKLKNVFLVADPAFLLEASSVELPKCFDNDVVGINISNFVKEKNLKDSAFFKSLLAMIEHILSTTNYEVVLIPHVFWEGQDDRVMCDIVKQHLSDSKRVIVLNSENMNYCQIRYVISKCKLFIGARTHSMISAYATTVPSLALGYSIKARGIAKDLGLDERLVVDYKKVKSPFELIERFDYLNKNESTIRNHLQTVIPQYIQKAYLATAVLKK